MLKRLLGTVAAAALVIAVPVPSHADTYLPTAVDQDFDGSAGGWTASATYGGLCLPQLLCPAVTSGYAAGGADGNGYLRTSFSTLVATVAGTSTATWESPAFTYNGAAGAVPASVTFDMNVLQDLGALLGLSVDNTSSYRVDLVDQTNGNAIGVVDRLAGAERRLDLRAQRVDHARAAHRRSRLQDPDRDALHRAGHRRRLRRGRLRQRPARHHAPSARRRRRSSPTTRRRPPRRPPRRPRRPAPTSSNRGSGITTRKELRKLTKTFILPKSAKVRGKNLQLKLRCPAKAAPLPCKIQVEGLSAGKFSKPATARKFVSIKADKKQDRQDPREGGLPHVVRQDGQVREAEDLGQGHRAGRQDPRHRPQADARALTQQISVEPAPRPRCGRGADLCARLLP